MTVMELNVIRRGPLDGVVEAYSAATLERVELVDGRRLVLKHLPAEGDWLTRTSGGTDRVRRLWESGLLHRVGRSFVGLTPRRLTVALDTGQGATASSSTARPAVRAAT